jgi:hypothetical protein
MHTYYYLYIYHVLCMHTIYDIRIENNDIRYTAAHTYTIYIYYYTIYIHTYHTV